MPFSRKVRIFILFYIVCNLAFVKIKFNSLNFLFWSFLYIHVSYTYADVNFVYTTSTMNGTFVRFYLLLYGVLCIQDIKNQNKD